MLFSVKTLGLAVLDWVPSLLLVTVIGAAAAAQTSAATAPVTPTKMPLTVRLTVQPPAQPVIPFVAAVSTPADPIANHVLIISTMNVEAGFRFVMLHLVDVGLEPLGSAMT